MSLWLALAAVSLLLVVLGAAYLTAAVARFAPLRRIQRKGRRRLLSFGVVALGTAGAALMSSLVNAIIIYLHAVLFFLLFGLVGRLVGKQSSVNWTGWLALVSLAVYLGVGFYLCQHVWQTDYTLQTNKNVESLRVALFADSHIGTTFDGEGFAAHVETIKSQRPDMVLIAGDFVDDWSNRADMLRSCEALGTIDAKYGVWFAYGNHDKGFFSDRDFSAEDLERALEANNVRVLEDELAYVGDFCVVGRRDATYGKRKELAELLDGADAAKYIIVLEHEPTDYDRESKTAADLVVSGHTHGGQLFPINRAGEWIGVNDKTYGYERRGGVDFIVTSGISCWAMRFKTGTRSEYVMITVSPERN